ncbi:MAG: hypothetical protein WCR53_01075 [Bacteroidaceae bacterium]
MHQSRLNIIYIIIFIGAFLSFSSFSRGEETKKVQRIAYGNLVDNITRKNIDGARLYRLSTDSTVIDSSKTEKDKNAMETNDIYDFFVPSTGGDWLFRIYAEGYETITQKIHIPPFKGRQFLYHIPDIILKKKQHDVKLAGAVVRATKIKFYTHGDTLVYNADAFNLAEGSMLDALIRQLPGAQLKDDGEIFVNGQKVESLLLNGEDFFKNNRQLMLDNLPAYTVKDVQVYRKRNKLSEWAGRDVGEKDLVMDVKLKKEYQTSWISNLEAGSGSENRYMGRFFAMRFTDHSNLSFFGNMNNLNDSRRPGQDGDWSPDKMPSGLEATKLLATTYEVKDRQKRFQVNGDAQLTHSDGDYVTSTTGENFLPQGNTFLRSQNLSKSHSTSFSTNHDWNFGHQRQGHEITWNLNLSNWRNYTDNVSATFEQKPFEYGNALLDSIRQFNAGSMLRRLALNRQLGQTLKDGSNYDFKLSPEFRFKSIATDFFVLNASVQFSGRKENIFANNLYDYPKNEATSTDFRRQWNDQREHNQKYLLQGTYCFVFPNNLGIVPSYSVTHMRNRARNPLYRLDKEDGWGSQEEHAIGTLPSETDFLLHTLDSQNSSWRHSVQTNQNAEINIFWNSFKQPEVSYWDINGCFPLIYSDESMDYCRANYNGRRNRHLTYIQPRFTLLHNWKSYSVGWWLTYHMDFQPFDMVNVLEIENNADPLNIYNGNPNQKNATTHNLHFDFFQNDKKSQRNWDVNLEYIFTQNAQTMAYILDRTTGVRHYTPDNVNGNYLLNVSINSSIPLDKLKRLTLSSRTYGQYAQSVDMISNNYSTMNSLVQPQRSNVHTTWMTENLKLEYKIGKITFGTKGYISWNEARSRREGFQTVQVWDFNYGLTGLTELPWEMQLSTDFTMYSRRGYDNPSSNTNDLVWNARLAKRLMHGAMTLAIDGFDILGQLSNLTQTMNSQGRFETYRNALPRYVMAHLIYHLNIKPKQKNTTK